MYVTHTSWLICEKVGLAIPSLSAAMRLSAVLSNMTTESAFRLKRLRVKIELYGCTTTSPRAPYELITS